MPKNIPYEKLTKRKRKALDAKKRGSWGAISPVTRKPPDPKAYNRNKARQWQRDHEPGFVIPFFCRGADLKIPRRQGIPPGIPTPYQREFKDIAL